MKILVPVKRVLDYNLKVQLKTDGSGVEIEGMKMSMNPFDEIAIEEAVRLREQGIASQVVVVSIGEEKSQEVIRTAMAMGADLGIYMAAPFGIEPLGIAKILKQIVVREKPDLVIMGKQAIDDDAAQVGPMLASLLNWPQGTFASKLMIKDKEIMVSRETDSGIKTVLLDLPAVITTDLRLNQPRYATLPNIMRARSKPLTQEIYENLGVDNSSKLKLLKFEEPQKRKSGLKMEAVDELIRKLKSEAGM